MAAKRKDFRTVGGYYVTWYQHPDLEEGKGPWNCGGCHKIEDNGTRRQAQDHARQCG